MNKPVSVLLFFLLLLGGCKEFIEPSLDGKTVALLAPGDQQESNNYQQTFWWEKHEDALNYRLQIVNPKFDSVARLVIDTVVSTDKFIYTLDPGKYQWRVRPENGSSHGEYTVRSFVIYPSSIKDQQVQLSTPGTGLMTATTDVRFDWLKLFGAANYRIQIDNNSFADETKLTLDVVTDNLSFIQKVAEEGLYQWRIRAEGEAENSKWSVVRTFIYDATPPDKVVLSSPADKQSVAKPVKLLWNSLADADKYELSVYRGNTSTLYNNSFPQILNVNNFNFTLGEIGETVDWRVRAIDKAGNKGEYSDLFSFTIQ